MGFRVEGYAVRVFRGSRFEVSGTSFVVRGLPYGISRFGFAGTVFSIRGFKVRGFRIGFSRFVVFDIRGFRYG